MPDHDTDADVIAAGPEPGRRPRWPGGLLWLIVLAETVALAVAVTAAVHYRAQARAPHPGRAPAASVTTSLPMPEMTTVALALPADGAVTGTVVITAAALPGAGLVEFTVSAVITGGQPGTVYDLDGNDCSTISPLGDHVWATGVTSAASAPSSSPAPMAALATRPRSAARPDAWPTGSASTTTSATPWSGSTPAESGSSPPGPA